MEGVALDNFNKLKPYTIPLAQFHSHLSDESDQDASTTTAHLRIILQFVLTKQMIAPFLTTMWYHTDGYANHYCCASAIYLLLCIASHFSIIIDRSIGAPRHGKYVVDVLNDREKCMRKLDMSNLLNT